MNLSYRCMENLRFTTFLLSRMYLVHHCSLHRGCNFPCPSSLQWRYSVGFSAVTPVGFSDKRKEHTSCQCSVLTSGLYTTSIVSNSTINTDNSPPLRILVLPSQFDWHAAKSRPLAQLQSPVAANQSGFWETRALSQQFLHICCMSTISFHQPATITCHHFNSKVLLF